MVWRQWGGGPPLLLLHGGYGSWTHWIRNIPELSRHYTLLVPDMPGYGDSDPAPAPYCADSLAGIVAQGLDRLIPDGTSFALVGFSFGGIIGGHVACLRPERLRRLVLVGAGGFGLPRAPMAKLTKWQHLASPAERERAHRTNLAILMIHDERAIDRLAVHLQAENTRRARTKSRPISRTDSLLHCLPKIKAPLAGIWGAEDATARTQLETRHGFLVAADPNLDFALIPGAGHWVQYEAAEPFNGIVTRMLATERACRTAAPIG